MFTHNLKDRFHFIANARKRNIRRTRNRDLVIGASVGTAVGIAAGILFAPRSGKQTRREIANLAGGTYQSLRDNVSDAGSKVIGSVKDRSERIRNAANACKDAAGEEISKSSKS